MFTNRYELMDTSVWKGRIDSTENYDAFRWHQWVRPLDLRVQQTTVLEEGQLGFALLGFCCDEGIKRNQGRTGAKNGPLAIRRELANLPCAFSPKTIIYDAGDITCLDGDLAQSQAALAKAVARIRQLGLFPLVMGGGHELALGHYSGHKQYLESIGEQPDIGIINFDAHFDLRPLPLNGSSGTMFRQIADLCSSPEAFKYLCIGIEKYSNTLELFKTADALGVKYLLEKDIATQGHWYVVESLLDFVKSADYIYITICADVFSTAFAPGVSAVQPLGLHPEAVLQYLKHIIGSGKVVGFDIAEVSPRFDQDSTTASLAKVLIFATVITMCRLKGLES